MSARIDITGQRFGKLTAQKIVPRKYKHGKVKWQCRCDCGTILFVRGTTLTAGDTKSCGCLKIKDLTGQRFNRLVALCIVNRSCGKANWKFQCDCGNITIVRGTAVQDSNVKSCGCVREAGRFFRGVKIDMRHVSIEVVKCIQAYFSLRRAIKEAS